MCGVKLKTLFALLVLSLSLLSCPPLCSAQSVKPFVTMTQEEAQEMLKLIEESRKDLAQVKQGYEEQKKSYETQLTEARKEKEKYKTCSTMGATSSVILTVLCIIAFIL